MNTIRFEAEVNLGKNVNTVVQFSVEVEDGKDEMSLVWDDVFEKACSATDELYSEDDFPNMDIVRIFIKTEDGTFPVLNEDDKPEDLKDQFKRMLILPLAHYSLSPEYRLWMNMHDKHLVQGPFDYDQMHELLKGVTEEETDGK